MKSIINKEEEKKEEIKYPCLMRFLSDDINLLVLMYAFEKGIVLHDSSNSWLMGQNHEQFDMLRFAPFTGRITLFND